MARGGSPVGRRSCFRSARSRAKALAQLQRAFDARHLTFAGGTADLAHPATAARFLQALRATDWVVYAKRPFAGPDQVLAYLGRYTHRVAVTNDRLLSLDDGVVRFRWKDYADRGRVKVMALAAEEFLRRFLLHVLPTGFMRIRHVGLLANRARHATLARCRHLLDQPPLPAPAVDPLADLVHRLTGADVHQCPSCQVGRMRVTGVLAPRAVTTQEPPFADSS